MLFRSKNPDGEDDFLNLPEWDPATPSEQRNWGFDPKTSSPEINMIHKLVESFQDDDGLEADDLLRTFVIRRVYPLQERVHKMCHMSGRYDPTRTSTHELTKPEVWRRVKAIAKTQMSEEWEWGMEPHSRANPPPQVSIQQFIPT